MAEARGKLANEQFTEDEIRFLEAIKRTQLQVNPPDGINVDVGAIAAKAFASYLQGVENEKQPVSTEFELSHAQHNMMASGIELRRVLATTTPGFQKAVGELFQSQSVDPAVEFRRDFFYTVIPTTVLLFLGGIYLFLRSKLNLPYGPLASALLILTIAVAGGLAVSFLKSPVLFSKHIGFLRYSGGALTGGLFVAAIGLALGTYGFTQKVKWQQSAATARTNFANARIDSTTRTLAEVGFSTVGTRENDSLESTARMNVASLASSDTFVLQPERDGKAMKVETKPNDTPTSVVLHIEPKKADVYRTNASLPDYQIFTGTVDSISERFVEIKPDNSAMEILRISLVAGDTDQTRFANWIERYKEAADMDKLKGEEVKVLFDTKSSKGLKMSLLAAQGGDSLIYNAALSNIITKASAPTPMSMPPASAPKSAIVP